MNKIILIPLVFLFQSCVTREYVNARIWLNNFHIAKRYCDSNPDMSKLKFYRDVIVNGESKLQTLSVCDIDENEESAQFVAMKKADFLNIMNKLSDKSKK